MLLTLLRVLNVNVTVLYLFLLPTAHCPVFFGTAPPMTFHRISNRFKFEFTFSVLATVKVLFAGHVFNYDDIDMVDMKVVFFL
jgi:hypothetical protein